MKVGFIGAGRVGKTIGQYFLKKGLYIQGYFSRTQGSAKTAAELTCSRQYSDKYTLVQESDVIAIAVPDDIIDSIAKELCHENGNWEGKIVVHFSGAHTSTVLEPFYQKGASICSLHPMYTFADYQGDGINDTIDNLRTVFFAVEGKGEGKDILVSLIKSWGNPIIEIEEENKVLYHCAGCVGSNYLVTLMDTTIQMLKEAGFEEKQAMDCIEPLIRKTVDNIFELGTKKALTGPISRGDMGTVKKHKDKLIELNKDWLDMYTVMGDMTFKMKK